MIPFLDEGIASREDDPPSRKASRREIAPARKGDCGGNDRQDFRDPCKLDDGEDPEA